MVQNVLPNAASIDKDLLVDNVRVQKLVTLAMTCGGACTKRFAQGSNSRRAGLARFGIGEGVCFALSAMWILSHVTDKDFWGELINNKGLIEKDAADFMIEFQNEYKQVFSHTKNDFVFLNLFFEGINLVQRPTSLTGSSQLVNSGPILAHPRVAGGMLAEALAATRWEGGSYKYFRMSGSGAHATAAWVAEDVTFFDPNYGEYWFETRAGFRKWFVEYWGSITSYGWTYTNFELGSFAKAVDFTGFR